MSSSDESADPLAETLSGDDPAFAATAPGAMESGPRVSVVGPAASSVVTSEDPGRYQRDVELGRGGMGRVVLATDRHLGREVAMKELLAQARNAEAAVSVGAVTRFLREARITGQLEHPSIVPVHELGQREDGTLYYTMKRIRGRSLASALRDAQELGDRLKLLGHFRDVCEAVAYAHSRGVVHRDLKPENVMVGEFGETLVVDWGLAKVKGEADGGATEIVNRVQVLKSADAAQTMDGHAIGTPAYMSPEQARGDLEAIDERSDVWGLGAMLFEILSGRAPYRGKSALEVLEKVLQERPPRVREVEPLAPPELAAIADRALMHDPTSRYPGARELAAEIGAFQDGGQVKAYEYGSWELLARFVRRNRAASIAALFIVGAISVSSVLVLRAYRETQAALSSAEEGRRDADDARERAEEAARSTAAALTEALLQRAERALESGDPSGAAIYAAASLTHAPDEEDTLARERGARGRSILLDAEAARRFVFARRIEGAGSTAALSQEGRTLAYPIADGLALRATLDASDEVRLVPGVDVTRVLAFVSTERVLAAGRAPGIYSLADGSRVQDLPEHVMSASVHGDEVAYATEDGVIHLLPADVGGTGGALTRRLETEHRGVVMIARGPGGRLAIAGRTFAHAEIFEADGGTLRRVELPAPASAVVWSRDGSRVAIAMSEPSVLLVPIDPSATPHSIVVPGVASGVAFTSEGDLAVASGSDEIAIIDPQSARVIDTLHVPRAEALQLSAAGSTLVALPVADARDRLRASVFTTRALGRRQARELPGTIVDIARAPRASRVVVATASALYSLELGPNGPTVPRLLATLPTEVGYPSSIAVSEDGSVAVTTVRSALVWISAQGEISTLLEGSDARRACALPVLFDPTAARAFTGRPNGSIALVRASGSALAPLSGHRACVCDLAISADGRTLASASLDGTVRIWDVERSRVRERIELSGEPPVAVALTPDARRIAIADRAGFVEVRSLASDSSGARFHAHHGWISRLGWSDDARVLVSAGADGSFRVHGPEGALERVVAVRGAPYRALVADQGRALVFHDAASLVVTPMGDTRRESAEAMLDAVERRAGMRLVGVRLEPID